MTVFNALRRWVENGTAPETPPVKCPAANGTIYKRLLPPYPQQARYIAGDVAVASSFRCVCRKPRLSPLSSEKKESTL
ncbi:hypothetical protein BJX68DRAFT_135989 [Aspergillus pseudodeflectus]|uniref:Carboxylic ester hydrolase n=1 Tax=Aspergillus pseudodeflectus TaxID=176178 RepID=A0ABR4JYC9_9EURO